MAVWNWFEPLDLERAWAWELMVLIHTPGFTYRSIQKAFAWPDRVAWLVMKDVAAFFEDDAEAVLRAARANYESLTYQDGLDWLYALLSMFPGFSEAIPLVTVNALRTMRGAGASAKDIGNQFRVSPLRVHRWWTQDCFDPLTGHVLWDEARPVCFGIA